MAWLAGPIPRGQIVVLAGDIAPLRGRGGLTTMLVLFHMLELGIMANDARGRHRKDAAEGAANEHRLRGRPSRLVDELCYPFSVFLSLHYDAKIV